MKVVTEAVRLSVDQVYEAYWNPTKTLETTAVIVTDLIPFVDREEENNHPLFQVTDGVEGLASMIYKTIEQ